MDLTEIISNSFKYPGSNQEHPSVNRKRWLVFGLIMLAGYLVIPLIFAAGYRLRATTKTIQGDSEMPECLVDCNYGDYSDLYGSRRNGQDGQ